MIKNDKPAKRFQRELLDEATFREFEHHVIVWGLDIAKYEVGDSIEEWAAKSGVQLSIMEEGGAVIKRSNGAFVFIAPDQLKQITEVIDKNKE